MLLVFRSISELPRCGQGVLATHINLLNGATGPAIARARRLRVMMSWRAVLASRLDEDTQARQMAARNIRDVQR